MFLLFAITVLFSSISYGGETHNPLRVNLDTIKQIESSGNPDAISFRGAKYGRGLYQISEVCLADYNQFAGHVFTFYPKDLFNPKINEMIAKWYLTKRIPAMLRHYNKEVTVENVLWAYSAGIGRVVEGVMSSETKEYIFLYKNLDKVSKGSTIAER